MYLHNTVGKKVLKSPDRGLIIDWNRNPVFRKHFSKYSISRNTESTIFIVWMLINKRDVIYKAFYFFLIKLNMNRRMKQFLSICIWTDLLEHASKNILESWQMLCCAYFSKANIGNDITTITTILFALQSLLNILNRIQSGIHNAKSFGFFNVENSLVKKIFFNMLSF